MQNLLLFLLGIIIIVVLATRTKINIGVISLAVMFVIGGLIEGYSISELMSNFPFSNIFFVHLVATMFFGFANQVGMFGHIVDRIVWWSHGSTRMIPIALLAAGCVVNCVGGSQVSALAIISPMVFAYAKKQNLSPLFAAFLASCSAMWGTFLPWTVGGATILGALGPVYGEETAYRLLLVSVSLVFAVSIGLFFLAYFKTGIHKQCVDTEVKMPETMTPEQKKCLWVTAGICVLLILPNFIQTFAPNPVTKYMSAHVEIRMLCVLGCVLLHFLKVGNLQLVIKEQVPWSAMIAVSGTAAYVSMGKMMGVMDTLGAAIGTNVSPLLIPVALFVVGALLSMIAPGNAIQLLLFSLVPSLSVASGVRETVLLTTAMIGPVVSAFSPFSTGGSMCVVGADENTRDAILGKQFRAAMAQTVFYLLLVAVGVIPVLCKLFGV